MRLARMLAIIALLAGIPIARGAPPKPNIVYILADDLGYGDVGAFNGNSKIPTPAMDAMAKQGMRFTDAHTNSAVCTPTRYGILTGRYAWRSRLKKGVLNGYDEPLIDANRLTVASLLKQNGYATACVGKWHLGLGWQSKPGDGATTRPSETSIDFTQPLSSGPHTLGFDYSFIIPASLDMDPYVYIEDGKVVEQPTNHVDASPRPKFWRAGPIAPSFKFDHVLGDFTARAQGFIDRSAKDAKSGKPFFLYLPLNAPHTPHVPSNDFEGKNPLGPYGDFVMETDRAVGRVIDALHRNGLEENTLVIITSDNGAHSAPLKLDEQGHKSNGEWRGQKSDAWEGGHRVPFIVHWPSRVKPGSTCEQTICSTDLMATVAQLIGASVPDGAGEDSVSFLGLLDGSTIGPTRQTTVLHSMDGAFAVRQGDWMLILCRGSGGWTLRETQATKQNLPPIQLYNLAADPAETKNVAAEHPDVVERLRALLSKYQNDGRSVARSTGPS